MKPAARRLSTVLAPIAPARRRLAVAPGAVRRAGIALAATALAAIALAAAPRSAVPQASSSEPLAAARDAHRTGRYDQATAAYRRLAAADGRLRAPAERGLVQVLAETGRYAEAERLARAALERTADASGTSGLLLARARALRATGRSEEAEAALRRALAAGGADSVEIRLELAFLLERRGAREEAWGAFERVAEAYAGGGRLSSRELTAAGRALARLGVREPDLYRAALRAFDEARAADPGDPEPRVRTGELFLDRYDSREAGASFGEVLAMNPRHPGALLGMARRAWFDGSSEAFELARSALETNPRLVPARVFLARLHLDVEEMERGEAEARRALETDPASRGALATLAAARYLAGDRPGYAELERRVLGRSPRYAGFHVTVAELAVRNRLYADAVELARRAVELDPEAWEARGILGINLLRTGAVREGREQLEAAFAGDPFNPWYKNTLDLLDVMAGFREVEGPRVRLVLQPGEAELLPIYMIPLAEEALDRLAARYGGAPDLPLRVEVFDRHADFSVRTVGLAGLGALGVSFGSVLAMDSPSARERGSFSWASTLWHEISHAFTLALTDHRIPRWFSEGLAVLDEHRARPAWGADPGPDFLIAARQDRLLPLERLNRGFVRPTYPGQVQHAYLHAYLICRMIEEEDGREALLGLLAGYRNGGSTDEVFRAVLGAAPEAFDRRFRAWLEARYAAPLAALEAAARRQGPADGAPARPGGRVAPGAAGPGLEGEPAPDDFLGQLARGRALFEAGRRPEARPYLERAKALFPGYAGPGAPQVYLAEIHAAGGDPARAAAELEELTRVAEDAWEPNLRLAELLEARGELRGAAEAWERALQVDPFEPTVHERLAAALEELGAWEEAVRERRALVALEPVDRAGALYHLARALEGAGRAEEARRTVLRALELAPSYEEALDLLLRLSEEREGGSR